MADLNLKINDKSVAFITEWRERATQQQRKYRLLSFAVLTGASIIVVIAFFLFRYANYQRIVEQNMYYVQDSTIQEANRITLELEHARLSASTLAIRYKTLMDYGVGDSAEDRLLLLQDNSIFDYISYITPDGRDIGPKGSADVSDREYFKRAMSGESGWDLIKESRMTEEPSIVFYAPVFSGGSVIGVITGFYEQDRLEDLFQAYQLFNITPRSYLLQGDGSIISHSEDAQFTGNLLEWLSQKNFIGATDYDEIMSAITSPERTVVNFSFADNSGTSVGVIVQFADSDWMLLSILPKDVTAGMVKNANRAGRNLLIAISAVALLTILAVILFLGKQRARLEGEMAIASTNLETTVEKGHRQFSIIESLSDIFACVYYVDLINSRYLRVKGIDTSDFSIPDSGDAAAVFSSYVENCISEEYEEEMRAFLDIQTFRQRMEQGNLLVIEYQRSDQGWRRGTLVPAESDESGLTSVLFAVQNIDREKKKEIEAKEALREAYEAARLADSAKTTFLSNMSHDIRTPMNAIVGMTAIAAAHLDDTEKVSECLQKITSSSRHLLGLINEVLDMSKIESGRVDLSEENFSLSELIDNLITIHQPLVREKGHTLTVRVNNLTHEKVIGDSTRLMQVFTNLLSNAIKYTPKGGTIDITVTEKENNKPTVGWYEVTFKDNGIGMSEEYLENLFEPFTRSDDARVSKIQGTGLGMPIAQNIVRMMSGDISVESKINEGTCFTVSFALKLQTDEENSYDHFADLPILVVDDDPAACESTCAVLDSLTMKSEWVTSGEAAIERTVARHQSGDDYYAVIVDWKMPGMNGVQTTREIRRQLGNDIPIIIISAYDWSDVEQEAKEAGANAFLSKPLFKSRVVNLFNTLQEGAQKTPTFNPAGDIKRHDFSGKRILLAEDNEINCEIALELLQMAGFETEAAEDGQICVDKFTASQPGYYDLILMDIQMPVMDGYAAAQAIRALPRPDAQKIPIIAMTANAFSSDVRNAMDAGMNGHIAKPIDIKRVMRVLEDTLG